MTIIFSVQACLCLRVGCFIYSLINKNDAGVISSDDVQFYIYINLAYDLLNLTVIAHFFQWIDGINALVNIHKISQASENKVDHSQIPSTSPL